MLRWWTLLAVSVESLAIHHSSLNPEEIPKTLGFCNKLSSGQRQMKVTWLISLPVVQSQCTSLTQVCSSSCHILSAEGRLTPNFNCKAKNVSLLDSRDQTIGLTSSNKWLIFQTIVQVQLTMKSTKNEHECISHREEKELIKFHTTSDSLTKVERKTHHLKTQKSFKRFSSCAYSV